MPRVRELYEGRLDIFAHGVHLSTYFGAEGVPLILKGRYGTRSYLFVSRERSHAMMLDLNSWKQGSLLEAPHTVDVKWNAAIHATDDKDVQSEYGHDLDQLQIVHERIATAACEHLGRVCLSSRDPVGVVPKV